MPRVNQYTDNVQAQGIDRAQATDRDTGAAVGEGFARLGEAIGRFGHQQKLIEDDQAKMWANTAAAETEIGLRQDINNRVNSLDPTAPDYAEKIASFTDTVHQTVDDAQNALLARAPNRAAQKYIGMHVGTMRERLVGAAMNTQAELNAKYTLSIADNGVKANTDVLAANPSNDTYADLINRTRSTVGSLTTIDPDTKLKLINSAESTYANVQTASLVSRDPEGFLKTVNLNGGYTSAKGEPHTAATIRDFSADTVKPYSSAQVQAIADKVNAPSKYDDLFKQAATQSGVNWQELKLRAVVESGLNPDASSGQANGLMQLAPATAQALGVDAKDPNQAVPAAAGLMAKYQQAAGGDMSAVDMRYYGGEDRAQWGPNTQQYAANLGAVRAVLNGGASTPQVQPIDEQSIAQAKPGIAGWDKLTWPEKVKYVRQAESAIGKQLADDRSSIRNDLRDASASLLAGQNYPGLESPRYGQANLTRVFGADEGGRLYRQIQYDTSVGSYVQQMATMPAAQRAATLAQLKPIGGVDFAAKEQAFRAASEAATRAQNAQQKSPIEYAIQNGIANAKPLDFKDPDTLAGQLSDRVKASEAMANDYGTKAQIFTDSEVNQVANALGTLSGRDRIRYLGAIRVGLNDGRAFNLAMNELAPKNPTLAYAANLAARSNPVFIDGKAQAPADVASVIADGDIILNGRSLDKQMAKGDDPAMPSGSKANNFDDKTFQQVFQQIVGNGFQSPDAQRSAAQEKDTYNAVKAYYVARSYQQGKDLGVIDQKEVNNAVQAVIGAPWKNVGGGGTLFAPYGMPMEQFQTQWPQRSRDAVKAAGYSNDEDVDRILAKTVPVNLADGKYGFQNGTRLQTDGVGRPIVVDYSQPFVDQINKGPTKRPEDSYSNSMPMMRRY